MNLLVKIIFSFSLSMLIGLLIALFVLSILRIFVNVFELNYYRNNYWVLTISLWTWWISWIISFGCWMTILK